MMDAFYQRPLSGDAPYHVRCGPLHSFRMHWHVETELLYVLTGHTEVIVEDETLLLPPHTVLCVGSTEAHEILHTSPDCQALVIEFGYELLGTQYTCFTQNSFVCKMLPPGSQPALEKLLTNIATEASLPPAQEKSAKAAAHFRLCSLLYACTAELLSSVPMRCVSQRTLQHKEDMIAMQQMYEYVHLHYAEPITVEKAAALCHYEKTRFCQLFRLAMGTSFHRYLNACRVRAACRMLTETELPICLIAESIGFSDGKTFTRVFFRQQGMTPTAYRQLLPNKQSNERNNPAESFQP